MPVDSSSFFMWAVKDEISAWKCIVDGRPLATFDEDTANSPEIRARAFRAAHGKPATLLRFSGAVVLDTLVDAQATKDPRLPLFT